jgi:hypothetical protein
MNIASATDDDDGVTVVNAAASASKLAPSIALANTNTLTSVGTHAVTTAGATARPGLQYGVTLGAADQQMVNLGERILLCHEPAALMLWSARCAVTAACMGHLRQSSTRTNTNHNTILHASTVSVRLVRGSTATGFSCLGLVLRCNRGRLRLLLLLLLLLLLQTRTSGQLKTQRTLV